MPEPTKKAGGDLLGSLNSILGQVAASVDQTGRISITDLLSGNAARRVEMGKMQAQLQQMQLEDIQARAQKEATEKLMLPLLLPQIDQMYGQGASTGITDYGTAVKMKQQGLQSNLQFQNSIKVNEDRDKRQDANRADTQTFTRGERVAGQQFDREMVGVRQAAELDTYGKKKAVDQAAELPAQKATFEALMAQDPSMDTRKAKAIALGGQTAINALYPTQASDSRTSDEKNVDAILKAQEAGDYKKANMLLTAMSNKGNVLAVQPDGTVISGSGQAAADMMKNTQIRSMYDKARGNLTLLDGLRDMRSLIRRDTTGIYAVLGNTLQNVKQLSPEIASQVEGLQAEAEAIIANSPDIVEFRTGFNPDIPALKVAALATAIKYAQANNAGRAPTDNDVRLAMKTVGTPESWLTNPAEMTAGMDQLEKMTRREHERELGGMRLFGVDDATIASLQPPAPLKPADAPKLQRALSLLNSGDSRKARMGAIMLKDHGKEWVNKIDPKTGKPYLPKDSPLWDRAADILGK